MVKQSEARAKKLYFYLTVIFTFVPLSALMCCLGNTHTGSKHTVLNKTEVTQLVVREIFKI